MARLRGQDPKAAKPKKPIVLIYGKPGVRKSSVSLDFPTPYYLDAEAGASREQYTDRLKASNGAYLGPDDGANDFAVVLEEVKTLATSKHRFNTVVFDSYSKLFNTQIALDYDRMQASGRDMEKTFGAEKKGAINGTRQLIRWLEKANMNAIFVCHEKALWKDGKEVGNTFDGWDKLEYELDLALHIIKTGATCKARVVKSRLLAFKEGDSFAWDYAEFANRYGRDVVEADATPIVLATNEQVAKLTTLIDLLAIGKDQSEKWLEKAGAESFAEMDTETIGKCIEFLANKLPKES